MSRENTSPLPHGDGEGRCLTSSPCAALLWSVGGLAQPFALKIISKVCPSSSSPVWRGRAGMFIHHCASANAVPIFYEDVKMGVDVLQRAVLGKAREIHYLPWMSSRSAAGTADSCS